MRGYIPAILNGGVVLRGPQVDGLNGQVLATNGEGQLQFQQSGGEPHSHAISDVIELQDQLDSKVSNSSGGVITGPLELTETNSGSPNLAPPLLDGNWTTPTGWVSPITSGVLTRNSNGSTPCKAIPTLVPVLDQSYRVSVTVSVWTSGSPINFSFGGNTSQNISAAGTYVYSWRALATSGSDEFQINTPSSNSRFSISDVSVVELHSKFKWGGVSTLTADGGASLGAPVSAPVLLAGILHLTDTLASLQRISGPGINLLLSSTPRGTLHSNSFRVRNTDALGWANSSSSSQGNLILGFRRVTDELAELSGPTAGDRRDFAVRNLVAGGPICLAPSTVGTQPSAAAYPRGQIVFSDGRKTGEGVGAGSGVPAWSDGTIWRTYYDNQEVQA